MTEGPRERAGAALRRSRAGRWLWTAAVLAGYSWSVAVVALPIVAERAVEDVSFTDRLGTFPVEVSLCHDGRSTLATGVLGNVYVDQTGPLGFGAVARVTAPPEAGGTLASYVDPAFIQANVQFIDDPSSVVAAYADKFRSGLLWRVVGTELVVGVAGGVVLLLARRRTLATSPEPSSPVRHALFVAGVVAGATVVTTGVAGWMFQRWDCQDEPEQVYALPDVPGLAFGSPQTLEVARQVRPFLEKNNDRIRRQAERYVETATETWGTALAGAAETVAPREGEVVVLAEADPQGSFTGARVRAAIYADLLELTGEDAVALRTISGDITSNGTVAEARFVKVESAVAPGVPVVAAAGDHDSPATVEQMQANGIAVPHLDTTEVEGLRVSAVNDPERKALFGALISNTSGVSPEERGTELRELLDGDGPVVALMHQAETAQGYLGIDRFRDLDELTGSLTEPADDGIPDLPAGVVNVGHWHEADGPWVVWNTDTDEVTWTVVDLLGTAGGVENRPTFNRFSTPDSAPLKPIMVRLQYLDRDSGLMTGFATVTCSVDGLCSIGDRVDVGLPASEDGGTGVADPAEETAGAGEADPTDQSDGGGQGGDGADATP